MGIVCDTMSLVPMKLIFLQPFNLLQTIPHREVDGCSISNAGCKGRRGVGAAGLRYQEGQVLGTEIDSRSVK